MNIIYLERGERRPRGDKALLIRCRPRLRDEIKQESFSGATWTINTANLEMCLAEMKQAGAKRVYVRNFNDA